MASVVYAMAECIMAECILQSSDSLQDYWFCGTSSHSNILRDYTSHMVRHDTERDSPDEMFA